jgi:hypothetical protein
MFNLGHKIAKERTKTDEKTAESVIKFPALSNPGQQ